MIVPRQPLVVGSSYDASITVGGQTHAWRFTVSAGTAPAAPGSVETR